MCLWDDSFTNTLKKYQLHSSAIEGGGVLHSDLPPVRALVLGQGKILVGTKNSEVSRILLRCSGQSFFCFLRSWKLTEVAPLACLYKYGYFCCNCLYVCVYACVCVCVCVCVAWR